MKQLTLILHPEDTGKGNYINGIACPIAASLRRAGFNFPVVGVCTWKAMRITRRFPFVQFVSGTIPWPIYDQAHDWARVKQEAPITFNLSIR